MIEDEDRDRIRKFFGVVMPMFEKELLDRYEKALLEIANDYHEGCGPTMTIAREALNMPPYDVFHLYHDDCRCVSCNSQRVQA